jgi:hypothetical protein
MRDDGDSRKGAKMQGTEILGHGNNGDDNGEIARHGSPIGLSRPRRGQ